MPAHLERRQSRGDTHAITFSCHNRCPYLATPEAKDLFLAALERTRAAYQFHLYAYVVMPEHVHLLLSEPRMRPLATALGALKTSVSKLSLQRPFWLPRYYDFNVFTNGKRLDQTRYIHRNPVRRGLVGKPEDYPWSSFRHYARQPTHAILVSISPF